MKFTTSLALSGLIASSIAAPSRPNQASGHRQSLQKSQSSAGSFALPSGFSGSFGGQGGRGGQGGQGGEGGQGDRARPTGSYSGWGSQQSSAASSAQPSDGFSGSGSGFGSGSQSSAAAPTGTGSNSGSGAAASSEAIAPIASSAAAPAPVASSVASSAVSEIASVSTKTKSSSTSTATKAATSNADDEYNVSWAGAVLDDGGETIYTGVYSEFTIPVPTKPTSGETDAEVWTVSSWVGIDGYSQGSDCQGLWQAGVDASIDSSGTVTYDPWYEWYPAETLGFSLTVTAGDVIAVNLTYSSFTEGTVTMENKSTGKSETKTVTSTDVLCGQAAEWIMEDLSIDGSTIGLANYGNVTFTNAYATTSDGTQVGPSGALLMDIETTSNQILTSSSVTDDSVTVAYV